MKKLILFGLIGIVIIALGVGLYFNKDVLETTSTWEFISSFSGKEEPVNILQEEPQGVTIREVVSGGNV